MHHYSLLDLSPVPEGQSTAEALANTVSLAQMAEAAGYHRYWLAEHHNMPGIASAATAVVIGHVAAATQTMRVGAGGIMLPNHAPLLVAETFGTLETLNPGRIDLGVGRAPGTDMATARALRRHMSPEDSFPQDVVELLGYLSPEAEGAKVRAFPGQNTQVPVWILGSSLYGAQLAAQLGLPYAFASHFAPTHLEEAIAIYRHRFQPSLYLERPYVMMAVGGWAADTDAEAKFLKTSQQLAFAKLRTGNPGKLPRPVENIDAHLPAAVLHGVNQAFSVSVTGSSETVRQGLEQLNARYEPDEIIMTSMIHDHHARLRSFEILANALKTLTN